MRLQWYYWGLVLTWHGLLVLTAYYLLRDAYHWFMLSQIGVFISLLLAYRVYRHLRRPLEMIKGGKSALQDRDFSVKYRLTGARELDALIQTYNDMIDTLRRERTLLQEQHFFLRKLIEASPSGILIMDHDGRITEANPAARRLLGFDPVGADPLPDHPLLAAAHELPLGASRPLVLGRTQHFRIEAGAFIDRGFHRKFVQIQTLTDEIMAAEKRAYGKVIRMMAHEVNNSIGAVNALLDTLRVAPEEADAVWVTDVLESLPIATQRNHRLNVFMRNFADVVRLPAPRKTRIDLAALVAETIRLFQARAAAQNTELHLESTPQALHVLADAGQLQQVLVNVLQNALESLERGGEIRVDFTPHPHRIIVADNGPGLNEAAAAGIFTPFYSTKPDGQGIGLTLVREILSQHGYRFSLTTDADGWTRFVIEL